MRYSLVPHVLPCPSHSLVVRLCGVLASASPGDCMQRVSHRYNDVDITGFMWTLYWKWLMKWLIDVALAEVDGWELFGMAPCALANLAMDSPCPEDP